MLNRQQSGMIYEPSIARAAYAHLRSYIVSNKDIFCSDDT